MAVPQEIISAAQAAQRKWNVWASVTVAQWWIESNQGRSMPAGSNNPFGIKALPGKPSVPARTREVINGQSVYITAQFAKFKDFAEAFDEHAKLLATSHYYSGAMAHAYRSKDPSAERFIDGLGSYATDPNYRSALKGLCRSQGLYKIDTLPEIENTIPKPVGVPEPILQFILWLLGNMFGGKGSTVIGILALIFTLIPPNSSNLSTLTIQVLAAVLVFFVGGKNATPQVAPMPEPELEPEKGTSDMLDPNVIKTFVEEVVPLLERVIPILVSLEPALKSLTDNQTTVAQRLQAIETALQTAEQSAGPANASIQDALTRLNNLSSAMRAV